MTCGESSPQPPCALWVKQEHDKFLWVGMCDLREREVILYGWGRIVDALEQNGVYLVSPHTNPSRHPTQRDLLNSAKAVFVRPHSWPRNRPLLDDPWSAIPHEYRWTLSDDEVIYTGRPPMSFWLANIRLWAMWQIRRRVV